MEQAIAAGTMNGDGLQAQGLQRLLALAERFRAGTLEPAVFAALYFFHWQIATHGDAFAARRSKSDPRPDAAAWAARLGADATADRLLDLLERYQYRCVRPGVPVALAEWLRSRWPLELELRIPTPEAVLRAQARGTRPVTVICDYPRMLRPVLHKSNAFAFFLHDLEHAYKFFHLPALHAAQRAFFAAMLALVASGALARYRTDALFAAKLDYVMSDMNTHPEHGRQYLRAILVEHCRRREAKDATERLSPAAEREIEGIMQALRAHEMRAIAPASGERACAAG